MFSYSLKDAVILGLAFLASGTLGAPVNVTGEAAWGRRAVSDPCSTEIARTGVVSPISLYRPKACFLTFNQEHRGCSIRMLRCALRAHLHRGAGRSA